MSRTILSHLNRNNYDNVLILDSSGTEFARASDRKAKWYLSRDLATIVSDNPLVIKLIFNPEEGKGTRGDDYLLRVKENICVICGTDKELTRHHVVPYSYRKHIVRLLDDKLSAFDVFLLCEKCHLKYEDAANDYRKNLERGFGISPEQFGFQVVPCLRKLKGIAKVLRWHADKLPSDRREQMVAEIERVFNRQVTPELLEIVAGINDTERKDPKYSSASEFIVLNSSDLDSLAIGWRQHFLGTMHPKFLPEGYENEYCRNVRGKND